MRWWNVKTTTPSGININRAWHIRQFLYALLAPAAALITMESVKRWESGYSERHPSRITKKPDLAIEHDRARTETAPQKKDAPTKPQWQEVAWTIAADTFDKAIVTIKGVYDKAVSVDAKKDEKK
jgi:hypothetical protein